ncbi:glycosyltransferase family protein [Phenylobacterium sp. J426]|uniref:glycosyltransferase family protein n=1 Tax=Phenylobacterium sp. J426 TaxID=2898439 RepID=UPI0021511094|nr:glycosyltransferase family protein [Phenylobacterium sp. J426]MCR5872852.1 glycosyltransferase family protein [Phenylobacterium sp. J426]
MTLAVLQARLSSTRLPGKVMKPLLGRPMILRQIERVRRAARVDRLVVATSTDPSDDPLAQVLEADGVDVFRGPLDDVLARFLGALDRWPADVVVRLTADCPLIDPLVLDDTIGLLAETGADYAHCRTQDLGFPKGQDVEAMTADTLRRAAELAETREEREHVTWGIWSRPDRYRIVRLMPPVEWGHVRWTVDRPDDFEFVTAVYEALYPQKPGFTSDDIRALVAGRPDLANYGGEPRI